MLRVSVQEGDLTKARVDAVITNLFEGVTGPAGATGALDKALDGAIRALVKTGDFTGKERTHAVLYTAGAIPAPRVVVVGLGKQAGFGVEAVRRAAGTAAKAANGLKVHRAATVLHGAGVGGLDPALSARAITESTHSALYRFETKGKPDEDRTELEELQILDVNAQAVKAAKEGVRIGAIVGQSQAAARDIASVAGDDAIPPTLAARIARLAKEHGVACKVLDKAAIRKERMHCFLAVNQGSVHEPRFVVLEHKPQNARTTVVLVGKGVTFDTGGISIKPSSDMDKMRYDKSGAAAVVGTLLAAARLGLPVHVVGLMPFTDNMPSGSAVKPGDTVETRSGQRVDVWNTDAEGRLILADALDYAKQYDADAVVDLATLTGAVAVALGTQAMAVMGNDPEVVTALVAAGARTHERVWELPFWSEYEEQIKGEVGDVKNVGGRNAGTITGGKFLEKFAPAHWAHLDIASVAWNDDKPFFNDAYTPKGATGAGVRLLLDYLETLSAAPGGAAGAGRPARGRGSRAARP